MHQYWVPVSVEQCAALDILGVAELAELSVECDHWCCWSDLSYLACSRQGSAFTPDRDLNEPLALDTKDMLDLLNLLWSRNSLPPSLEGPPSPSISPASHWQNCGVKGVARVVSEVPTRPDIFATCVGRWLPAYRAPDIMFWLRRGKIPLTYLVRRPDSEPFMQIAQCIMDVSMKGRCVQPKNPYSILTLLVP